MSLSQPQVKIWTFLESNKVLRGKRPMNYSLNHGNANLLEYTTNIIIEFDYFIYNLL